MEQADRESTLQVQPSALTTTEFEELMAVVWPSGSDRPKAMQAWLSQSVADFDFSGHSQARWGTSKHSEYRIPILRQICNGPCGLLSVLQAEITRRLLSLPSDADREAAVRTAVVDGITAMLRRAACKVPSAHQHGASRVAVVLRAEHEGEKAGVDVAWATSTDEDVVKAAIASAMNLYAQPLGAVLLLYSLVLTAGVVQVGKKLAGEDAILGVPKASSLIACSEEQEGGFCEVGLVSLAACGHAINAFTDAAWSVVKEELPPDIGVLTSEDEALGEDVVSPWLRTPRFPVWVVLHGGHYTTLVCLQGMDQLTRTSAGERDVSFAFIDGLSRTTTFCDVILGTDDELPTTSKEFAAMRAVEIVQRRDDRYYVICDKAGSFEGGARPRALDSKWYCRDCYLAIPRVFAFNDHDANTCKECGKTDIEAGYGHWLTADQVPPALLSEYERQKEPWELLVLRTHWPRAERSDRKKLRTVAG